jgi:hypothetical protein
MSYLKINWNFDIWFFGRWGQACIFQVEMHNLAYYKLIDQDVHYMVTYLPYQDRGR